MPEYLKRIEMFAKTISKTFKSLQKFAALFENSNEHKPNFD